MPRWLKTLLAVLAVLVVALASSPWWLGTALRPLLRARGVTFQTYERVGYNEFRLHHVARVAEGVSVGAEQIQAPTPLAWAWQRARSVAPDITIHGWSVIRTNAPEKSPDTPKRIRGLPDLRAALERVGPRVAAWLPRLELTNGELRGYGPDVAVAHAVWNDTTLTLEGVRVSGHRFDLTLAPAADGAVVLAAQALDQDARVRLALAGPDLTGQAVILDQPLQLSARFSAVGWVPVEASAVADNWELAAARVKLGAPYERVRGNARAQWRDGGFSVTVDARADPGADARKAPPFTARATARGTLRELVVEALDLDTPFATARLTAPVSFSLDRPIAAESARLTLKADLAKLPWIEGRGRVDGTVSVTGGTAAARQDFSLNFQEVAAGGFSLKAAQARGTLAWPVLEVTELSAQLDDTSSVEARGRVDWQRREFNDVSLSAQLGPSWLMRWLPAGAGWQRAELSATTAGPFSNPRHAGTIRLAGFRVASLHPLDLEATWEGAGARPNFTAVASVDDSTLSAAGTLEPGAIALSRLALSPDGATALELVAPARITWSPQPQVEVLSLGGPAAQATLKGRGGPDGHFAFSAVGFHSDWLKDWISLSGPSWQLVSGKAEGKIENAVLVFEADLTGRIAMDPQPAEVRIVARGDADGVELRDLQVATAGRVLTQARGRLPVSWLMSPAPHLVVDDRAPLELSASTEPDSPLWATLASSTGLEIARASAKADLRGSLLEPRGDLKLDVARLALAPARPGTSYPECTDLALSLQFGREQVTLSSFAARLDGQVMRASGRIPMSDAGWQQLWRAPREFDWSEAEARIEIPDADLAPFARHGPALFASRGRLRAHVELARGGKFSGALHLADAATRPLAPFGTLQDIQGELTFADRTLTVRSLDATLGGEPVTMDGSIALEPGKAPRLALWLKGSNLPLVRNTGLLLRTDLDLRASTDEAGLTRLSGSVGVRDCLVLASLNLRTLIPSGRRGVSRQPPYFSVEAEPFAAWALDVDLRANSAVRVRTTVYQGTASGQFKLSGTLAEPRAVGEVTVDEGRVLFPFATFTVDQGSIRLREADPFNAVVSVDATSQRRDYQLRLEMTGQLPSPNLVLSSTPAMDSADVLLMVMTGQMPASEATAATPSGGARLALLGAYLGRGLFQDLGFGGEDRLEISAGERISRDGRETYEFEYKLGGRWSLQGEYDQFDSYNAGLKWRAYTEESVPDEE